MRVRRPGQRRLPERGARHQLRRLRRALHLERLLAPRGLDVRPRPTHARRCCAPTSRRTSRSSTRARSATRTRSGNQGWAEYPWRDLNGDHFAQPGEVTITPTPLVVGRRLQPGQPHERALGEHHRCRPGRAPHARGRGRHRPRAVPRLRGVRQLHLSALRPLPVLPAHRDDDRGLRARGGRPPATCRTGPRYSIQTFTPIAARVAAGNNGRFATNSDDYTQKFQRRRVLGHQAPVQQVDVPPGRQLQRPQGVLRRRHPRRDRRGARRRRGRQPDPARRRHAERRRTDRVAQRRQRRGRRLHQRQVGDQRQRAVPAALGHGGRGVALRQAGDALSPSSRTWRWARTARSACWSRRKSTPSVSTTCGTWTCGSPRTSGPAAPT